MHTFIAETIYDPNIIYYIYYMNVNLCVYRYLVYTTTAVAGAAFKEFSIV